MTKNTMLHEISRKLNNAIALANKEAILSAYEEAKAIDLEGVDTIAFENYDNLVSEANNILYA